MFEDVVVEVGEEPVAEAVVEMNGLELVEMTAWVRSKVNWR